MTKPVIDCDFLVAGAGPSGITAAIEAGRLGLKTVLFEKEMYLGGNAGPNLGIAPTATQVSNPYYNETGIIEELEEKVSSGFLRMKPTIVNYNINPQLDSLFSEELKKAGVLYLRRNIVIDSSVANNKIETVTLMNIDTCEKLQINVNGFAIDCTGDAVLAQICGARTVMGRESSYETGERSAPETPDALISAASLTALVVDTGVDVPFIPPEGTPEWNPSKPDSRFDPTQKVHFLWQVDEGGENDNNHPFNSQQELWQHLLLRIYSQWNYIKNIEYPEQLKTHQLIWVSPVLGKRETKRIISKYMLSQTDIEKTAAFDDAIGFGGGYLDEHLPSYDGGYEVRYYSRPVPYDIPLRSACSVNIENLFAGGRCLGVTHLAFTSTRLIRTVCMLAQSTANAAWFCLKNKCSVDTLIEKHMESFQNQLRERDIFLPGHCMEKHLDSTEVSASSFAKPSDFDELSYKPADFSFSIFEYPKKIKKIGLWVKSDKQSSLTIQLAYGETPPQKYENPPSVSFNKNTNKFEYSSTAGLDEKDSEIKSVKGCINYFVRKDIPAVKETFFEKTIPVKAGTDGFICFDIDSPFTMPDRNRNIWGQALIVKVCGEVLIGVANPVIDTSEAIYDGIPNVKNVPVFKLEPECRWGHPYNAIKGQIARDGHSCCDAWVSNPSEKLPQSIELTFKSARDVNRISLHFDSTARLWKENYIFKNLIASPLLVKSFTVEIYSKGTYKKVFEDSYNFNRFRSIEINASGVNKIKITVHETWGSPSARICSIDVK